MKKIFLVRHGKSSWKDILLKDIDRPLNKRGKKDVPFMAELLKKKGIQPDIIISSPAKRAERTAKVFADKLGIEEVVFDSTIYEGEVSDILSIIQKYIKDYDNIFIFGHNPVLTDTANELIEAPIENIPTSGVVEIDFENRKLLSFEYPKKY